MDQIILHHYPQSPVSEKVRVGLGIKGLAWRSVEIPRMPPKPDLMPLTGGYRRTPVMQVGANVYCDSQCILGELERRFPDPTFMPAEAPGLPWVFGQWTDRDLFDRTVKLVLGSMAGRLPPDFAKDRARLYLGPGADLAEVQGDLPHVIAQIRAQFAWMDHSLAAGGPFMLGARPGLADALAYYLAWFVRGRWEQGPRFLSQFPALEAWEGRVQAIGHGHPTDLTSAAALDIARAAEPVTREGGDPNDPQGLVPGMAVTIAPDSDGGDPSVAGTIRKVDVGTIAIRREDERVGTVCVHFPRVGYRVAAARSS